MFPPKRPVSDLHSGLRKFGHPSCPFDQAFMRVGEVLLGGHGKRPLGQKPAGACFGCLLLRRSDVPGGDLHHAIDQRHSDGAKRACREPAACSAASVVTPAAAQRHLVASVGGVKAAVPVGRASPGKALPVYGAMVSVPPPAAAVVVSVIIPVAPSMAKLATLALAVGAL